MKPILHAILALALTGTNVFAAPVNEQQARTAAEAILVTRHPERNPELTRTVTPRGRSRFGVKAVAPLVRKGAKLGHVVTLEPGGYLLLRADDELSPLKLHSENGDFDALPPGFREVIELEMAEENSRLREIRAKGIPQNIQANRGKWMELLQDPVAGNPQPEIGTEASPGVVLLNTTWNQGNPYNLYCPTASGGPGGRAYAGCTAAALAQVLNYHGRPAAVLGDYSYTDNLGNCTGFHSISDAGMAPYKWADMPANLTTSSPAAQQQAVAQLMYHAAVALDSNFEAGGTGAYPSAWQRALSDIFGYTSGSYESRANHTNAEWFGKITTDITNNKPVLYAMWAADWSAGHAVVCDGYRNSDEIHLNLGWSGSGNAWYSMDSISASGYTWTRHGGTFGITPPSPGLAAPILAGVPSSTPGTSNTIFWAATAVTDPEPSAADGSSLESATSNDDGMRDCYSDAEGGSIERPQTNCGTANRLSDEALVTGPTAAEVLRRSSLTEHYFDPQDSRSDGVIILTPETMQTATPNGVAADDHQTTASGYVWWDWSGSLAIPDGTGTWVGINCAAPSGIPAGARVTQVAVHHEITHTYIGDLECVLYNADHIWWIRDNSGGSSHNVNETVSESSIFSGDDPAQEWYYRVRDTAPYDVGTLTKLQLYVFYDSNASADLRAPEASWKSATVTEGDAFWTKFRIENAGEATAPASHVRLYLSTDNDFDLSNDYYVGEKPVGSLSAGTSEWVRWDFAMPDLGSGSYPVWMVCVVDSRNEVVESDESNTFKTNSSFMASDRIAYADLRTPEASWKSVTVTEGDAFWTKFRIENAGEATAPASHAKLYLSTDNDFDLSNDYYVGEKPVGSLSAGTSEWVRWDFAMPDLGSGSYPVWMVCVVDSRNEVVESDESNTFKTNSSFTASDPPIEYYAECADNAGFSEPRASGWMTRLDHTFTDLIPGVTYWYRVRARQGLKSSEWSNVESSQQAASTRQAFDQAVAAAGLVGENAGLYASPFGDGCSNLLKYAFNMNLAGPDCHTLSPAGESGQPLLERVVDASGQPVFLYTYLRRRNSGLSYAPKQSAAPSGEHWAPMTGATSVETINATWERVSVRHMVAPGMSACFFRVEVTMPVE